MRVSKLTEREKKKAAEEFADEWKDKGNEKSDTQVFWLTLFRDVFGVEKPEKYISFEKKIKIGRTKYIDAVIKESEVFIEQKGKNVKFEDKKRQSDGVYLTPLEQVQRYAMYIPRQELPRWLVCCNFKEFLIFDWNDPEKEPERIKLENLPDELHKLDFLVRSDEAGEEPEKKDSSPEVITSLTAGEIVRNVYDALRSAYKDPDNPKSLHGLNVLCVRLVFCFYAEDAGLFGHPKIFQNYMDDHKSNLRRALLVLFKVLNTKEKDRDPYLENDLSAFPYVNGGLFGDEEIEIPFIDEEVADILINHACQDFDWSKISPTIFGAVFESTLNPETRRTGGMHYTSIENIHKVIDPLFLDDLKAELEKIKAMPAKLTGKTKTGVKEFNKKDRAFLAFQKKLADLKFLDPACGSGNFLTETYLSLRKLENEVIKEVAKGQISMFENDIVQVSINNFYGIEINDFAVSVARTALWIAENQMLEETQAIVDYEIEFLPLKTQPNIVKGNALRMDWNDLVHRGELAYIIGNPPFAGKSYQTSAQKDDMKLVFKGVKGYGHLDYVACWYKKSADYMLDTDIRAALVSTNSVTQGIEVPVLWSYLIDLGIKINFAYHSFLWNNEASETAQVACVIIGFSYKESKEKKLYYDNECHIVEGINPYLFSGQATIIKDRHVQISGGPLMQVGSFPVDGGNFVLKEKEVKEIQKKDPQLEKYIKEYIGGEELINNKKRYCLWIKDASPKEINSNPLLKDRVRKVKEFRLNSSKAQTKKRAETPTCFAEDRQPDLDYIMIPRTSSENRRYIPMGFFSKDVIAGDTIILPNANLYFFGILNSSVHMAWMRVLAGRLESRYRYSSTIVYNNLPLPKPTKANIQNIKKTAQAILDARNLYPDSSLADLYSELTMPKELRKAHNANDLAVMKAYGFKPNLTETQIVEELFKLYSKFIDGQTTK